MKKTVIASSLAVALGVTGYALTTDHSAHASEQTSNYAQLANLAQNNPSELNSHPVQAGAYNISFVKDGFQYNFTSNGSTWSWNYTYTGAADTAAATTTQAAPAQQSQATDYSASYNQGSNQSVSSNQQASHAQVKTVSAPSYSTYSAPAASSASTGGSVKAQFLANGGTEAAWNAIVMPESGGNPNAVSPNGYHGLGQTMESWGTGSVAQQTKGLVNYANSRYGSLDNAVAFRASHGWW
ncbi:transglycosylase [Staphylococcus petrasii]|uniref:aggregation-promoting factor C-terminal-like domain-containing protein n=1 Tax=Staphylococcus petrasii TaxID=1276936 RepID=UPI000CD14AB8|nr:transglycosylase [Staphylococcus petrasii]PNZ84211.1 transglycosylase [Staphylococcus petrasii]TGA81601.1 transglycosylase [Staphylococcus petrasii]SUM59087.1 SceA protein [Staphylococcus petrasii]